MNIILYIIIFIMGSLIGSFISLAVYRIPKKVDILYKAPFCPHCHHELQLIDNIPILSYLILGGKCRFCKKKISPGYLINEIFTGLAFVFIGLALKVDAYSLGTIQAFNFLFSILYFVILSIIGQMDFKSRYIDDKMIIFGYSIAILDNIYKYLADPTYNVNRFIIYLIIIVICSIANIHMVRKKKSDYTINIILLLFMMNSFVYEKLTIITVAFTLLIIAINLILKKLRKKKYSKRMPVATYLTFSNLILIGVAFYTILI